MRSFTFDIHGNLTPYNVIDTTIEEIESELVVSFSQSTVRAQLLEVLKTYLLDLSDLLDGQPFEILIDGSFVSRKVSPNDIDILLIIENESIQKISISKLSAFKCNLLQKKLPNYNGIHAFVIEKFEENDKKYILFQADWLHWVSFFSKDRKGNKKGVLRIVY